MTEYAVAYALHTLKEDLSLSELQAFVSDVNSRQRVKVEVDRFADDRFAVVLNCKNLAKPALYVLPMQEYDALQKAARRPYHIQDFVDQVPPATLARYLASGLLERQADMFTESHYTTIEVEINSHCNFRCVFCPVANAPKPTRFMTMDTFRTVLQRASDYGILAVSLNFYSEPTLDPKLAERIEMAAEHKLQVRLYTNASNLNASLVDRISKAGNVTVTVNLPTIVPEDYEKVTRSKLLPRVLQNVVYAKKQGLPVKLSINAPKETAVEVTKEINDLLAELIGESTYSAPESRAGVLDDPNYVENVTHLGLLSGCVRATNNISVNWEGRVFLCCNDYDQKVTLGDLAHESLDEIARKPETVQIRKWIMGAEIAPRDFICRHCEYTQARGQDDSPFVFGSKRRTDSPEIRAWFEEYSKVYSLRLKYP